MSPEDRRGDSHDHREGNEHDLLDHEAAHEVREAEQKHRERDPRRKTGRTYHGQRRGRGQEKVRHGHAAPVEHGRQRGEEDEGRSEIRLLQGERERHQHDEPRHDESAQALRRTLAPGKNPREEQDRGELRQLRRLEADAADVDPARRAARGLSGHENARQRGHRHDVHHRRDPLPRLRRNDRAERQRAEPEQGEDDLLLPEVETEAPPPGRRSTR